jgi:hypothetical protein
MPWFGLQYATGAMAIGVPGGPELAACTASMASVRMGVDAEPIQIHTIDVLLH